MNVVQLGKLSDAAPHFCHYHQPMSASAAWYALGNWRSKSLPRALFSAAECDIDGRFGPLPEAVRGGSEMHVHIECVHDKPDQIVRETRQGDSLSSATVMSV